MDFSTLAGQKKREENNKQNESAKFFGWPGRIISTGVSNKCWTAKSSKKAMEVDGKEFYVDTSDKCVVYFLWWQKKSYYCLGIVS